MKILQIFFFLVLSLSAEIGYISAIKGDVSVIRNGETLKANLGFKLEEKDQIKTARKSKAQIIFNDKTVIQLGRSSKLDIQEYFFNKTKKSKMSFRMRRGYFDVISGGISKYAKGNFKFKVKTATIGIRGTRFQGYSLNEKDEIRCLSGTITVAIDNEIFEVDAGEKAQLIMPKIKQTIVPKVKVIEENSNDKNSLQEQYIIELNKEIEDKIDEINAAKSLEEFTQVVSTTYDSLKNSDLSFFERKLAQSEFNKVTIENAATQLIPIFGEQATLSDSDIVNIGNFENYENAYWVSGESTSYETVSEKMGGFQENGDAKQPWDGTAENRQVIVYEGNDLANPDNKISFEIDLGNRIIVVNYEHDGETYQFINLSGFDQFSLNNIDYISKNIALYDEAEVSNYYLYANSYFFGENMEEIGGIMIFQKVDSSREDIPFLAEKTEVYSVEKEQIGEDADFSWGYWIYTDSDEVQHTRGGWIASNYENTPASLIEEYSLKSVKASYSGDVFGTYQNLGDLSSGKFDNGTFNMNFNFGDKTVTGDFNFEINNVQYSASGSGEMNQGLSSFEIYNTNASDEHDFYGTGQLFGENAEYIGGGFSYVTENQEAVSGTFKGSKN
jgi:predicted transcriptional regulator